MKIQSSVPVAVRLWTRSSDSNNFSNHSNPAILGSNPVIPDRGNSNHNSNNRISRSPRNSRNRSNRSYSSHSNRSNHNNHSSRIFNRHK